MDTTVIDACIAQNFAGKLPFPETLARLAAAGVRSYSADLLRLEKTSYGDGAETHVTVLPLGLPLGEAPAVADSFDAAEVEAAVRASQAGTQTYPAFLQRVMKAGCAEYSVFLRAGLVVYAGRDGDTHVERFPPAA